MRPSGSSVRHFRWLVLFLRPEELRFVCGRRSVGRTVKYLGGLPQVRQLYMPDPDEVQYGVPVE